MAENVRHKRAVLRRAMKNVVPLKRPPDCANLAKQLQKILLSDDPDDAERVAFERELRGLRPGQRAMIAARAANCERGDGPRFRERRHEATPNGSKFMKLTTAQCAKAVDVSLSLAFEARVVLKRATAAEIRAIEEGSQFPGAGIRKISDQLRRNLTPAQRKRLAEIPLAERGDGPLRSQNQRLKALVWHQLCDALQAAELPRIDDVVAIARSHDKTGLVDRKLLRAHERLGELIEAWTRPAEDNRG